MFKKTTEYNMYIICNYVQLIHLNLLYILKPTNKISSIILQVQSLFKSTNNLVKYLNALLLV